MKFRGTTVAILVCGILVPRPTLPARQQSQSPPSASPVRYTDVLDQAFQFSRGLPSEFAEADYRLVLRILPSTGLESQVVVYGTEQHLTKVIHYRLKQGTPSISEAYRKTLERDASATVNEVLIGISVERLDEHITLAKASLVDRLFTLSIATRLSPSVCMDGTIYELWVQTPSNQIHTSLSDCAYGERTESTPLFQWIKEMRAEFDKVN